MTPLWWWHAIVAEHSYGRQLGRLTDALIAARDEPG